MVIVAAVDQSRKAPKIVEEAVIGDAFDEPVEVVHVLTRQRFVDLERTSVTDTGSSIPTDDVIELVEDIAREKIEESGVDDASPVGLLGDPAEEIVSYAESNDARYLVIAGRKRSPVGKALFGSTVQSVMLESMIPTVIVQAD